MRAYLGVAVVVVRIYDVAGVGMADRRAALDIAQELLAGANTHVIFKVCGSNEPGGHPCDTVPEPEERIVRIIDAPTGTPPSPKTSLGNAVVDTTTNTGVLATVFADRIDKRAAGRIDRRLLLGRTIAHELGHLLLGMRTHSKAGLMRGFWSDEELKRNHVNDWAFSPEDRWRMCMNLLRAESLCRDVGSPGNLPRLSRTHPLT